MGIKKDAQYNLSISALKIDGNISKINFQFVDIDGNALGETSITPNSNIWKTYTSQIVAIKRKSKHN